MKKIITLAVAGLLSAFVISPAFADQYDATWVAKCVKDNKDQGQSVETLTTYCICMNGKMSSDETQSITTWEKTHKAENDACSKKAGWQG
jgi:hypothetical protein